jgi:hypothetical protein
MRAHITGSDKKLELIHGVPLFNTQSNSDPFSNDQRRKAGLIFCELQHNFSPCSSLLQTLMCQSNLIPKPY